MDFLTKRFILALKLFAFFCGYPLYGIFNLFCIFIPSLKKIKLEYLEYNTKKSVLVIDVLGTAVLAVGYFFMEILWKSESVLSYLNSVWQSLLTFTVSWLLLGYLALYTLSELKKGNLD